MALNPVSITVYKWTDLLSVFPNNFASHAQDWLSTSGDVTFGDAIYTVIEGDRALEILHNAWNDWPEASEHVLDCYEQLPHLSGELVAING